MPRDSGRQQVGMASAAPSRGVQVQRVWAGKMTLQCPVIAPEPRGLQQPLEMAQKLRREGRRRLGPQAGRDPPL